MDYCILSPSVTIVSLADRTSCSSVAAAESPWLVMESHRAMVLLKPAGAMVMGDPFVGIGPKQMVPQREIWSS